MHFFIFPIIPPTVESSPVFTPFTVIFPSFVQLTIFLYPPPTIPPAADATDIISPLLLQLFISASEFPTIPPKKVFPYSSPQVPVTFYFGRIITTIYY